jgi:hypothetical protein
MCIALTKNHEYTHTYSMFLIIIINHSHHSLKESGLILICDVFFHLNALVSSLSLE